MDAKKIFRILIVAIFATAMLSMVITPAAAQAGDPPDSDPIVWTNPGVCSGEDAGVYQPRENTGTGVTLAITDPWGCPDQLTSNQGLLIVEPWDSRGKPATGFDVMNADAACYVSTWSEAQSFANRTKLADGSFWIVSSRMTDDPVVVNCNDVTNSDELGLNPNELQIDPSRVDWVAARRAELLGADTTSVEEAAKPEAEEPAKSSEASADPAEDGVTTYDANYAKAVCGDNPVESFNPATGEVKCVTAVEQIASEGGFVFPTLPSLEALSAGMVAWASVVAIAFALVGLGVVIYATVVFWRRRWFWGLLALVVSALLVLALGWWGILIVFAVTLAYDLDRRNRWARRLWGRITAPAPATPPAATPPAAPAAPTTPAP